MALFANVTLMKSRINTGNSPLSALTNDERPMVGQAPYVVNAGLSWAGGEGATSATLLYNVTTVYAASHDAGIRWDSAGIVWPSERPIVSDRDAGLPGLAAFVTPFHMVASGPLEFTPAI